MNWHFDSVKTFLANVPLFKVVVDARRVLILDMSDAVIVKDSLAVCTDMSAWYVIAVPAVFVC